MVKWSAPARDDLRGIFNYIAQDSNYYAKNVINNIISKTDLLDEFPEMGRVVPEIGEENVRELFVYSYRIIYEIMSEDTYILTVVHGKRDFSSSDLAR